MITNRKIVVISGASSGIGLCITKQLAKSGNLVLAGARKDEDIARLSTSGGRRLRRRDHAPENRRSCARLRWARSRGDISVCRLGDEMQGTR